jgi:hypothetical protein
MDDCDIVDTKLKTASIKCNDVLENVKTNKKCDKIDNCRKLMAIFLQNFTGHPKIMDCFCSFEHFVRFMYQPCDAASLSVGRMLFGEF